MRSGFVAIIGRPNAGKSTLINAIVDSKIAIVSDKAGTTRNNIRGIYNSDIAQIIFTDTPGLHKADHLLGSRMNKMALSEIEGVDIIYYIIDANASFGKGDEFVLDLLKQVKKPVFLLLNKIDLLNKEELMNLILQWSKRYDFKEIFPISALKNDNLQELIDTTINQLPQGVAYYDTNIKTDSSTNFQVSELIREKILYYTQQEVPHSCAIVIDELKKKGNAYYVSASIVVERKSQKGILIGHNGSMIKKIGTNARKDIQQLLHKPLFLQLYVRVEDNWRDNPNKLYQLGYLDINDD